MYLHGVLRDQEPELFDIAQTIDVRRIVKPLVTDGRAKELQSTVFGELVQTFAPCALTLWSRRCGHMLDCQQGQGKDGMKIHLNK